MIKKQQKGFTIPELTLVILVLSLLFLVYTNFSRELRAESYANAVVKRVDYVIDNLQRYYMNQVISGIAPNDLNTYPSTMAELEASGDYIEACSTADVTAKRCFDYKFLPIGTTSNNSTGEPIVLTRTAGGDGYPELTMSFSLAGVVDNTTYNAIFNKLQMIPGFTIDASENVTLRITRPANAVHLENVVKRDGSDTLTGTDWDTGGDTWITNVRGLFLRNQDGSQYSIASGLTRTVVARHGDKFPVHSCPEGHTPDLDVMVKSLQPLTSTSKYGEIGAFSPSFARSGSNWVVYLNYYAKRTSDSAWVKLTDGFLKVDFICRVS